MTIVSCEPLRTPAEEASRAPGGASLIVLTKQGRKCEVEARCEAGAGGASVEEGGGAAGVPAWLLDVSLLDRMDEEALAKSEAEAEMRMALKAGGRGNGEGGSSDRTSMDDEEEVGMGLGGMFGSDSEDSCGDSGG